MAILRAEAAVVDDVVVLAAMAAARTAVLFRPAGSAKENGEEEGR